MRPENPTETTLPPVIRAAAEAADFPAAASAILDGCLEAAGATRGCLTVLGGENRREARYRTLFESARDAIMTPGEGSQSFAWPPRGRA